MRSAFKRAGAAPLLVGVCAALVLFVAGACGSATAPANAPANHTNFKGGAAHGPGPSNATVNCVQCHGADLQGGTSGEPSCFTCHGKKWD